MDPRPVRGADRRDRARAGPARHRCAPPRTRSAPRSPRWSSRLRARWATEDALRAFADDLDDATGDVIAANLILGARRRGAGLASVLDGLAESVAADVRARREIEADRAKPRATARWVTIITVGVLAFLAVTGNYVAPYGSPLGQVLLVVPARAVRRHPGVDAVHGHRPPPAPVHRCSRREAGRTMTAHHGCSSPSPPAPCVGARRRPADLAARPRRNPTCATPWTGSPRTTPDERPTAASAARGGHHRTARAVGRCKTLPAGMWARTPTRELAILRKPLSRFYGRRSSTPCSGCVIPPLLTVLFNTFGAGPAPRSSRSSPASPWPR